MMRASLQHSSSPQLGGHLVAVHPRQADVEEHDLGPCSRADVDGVRAVMGDPDRVARAASGAWPCPSAVSTLSSTTSTRKPRRGSLLRPLRRVGLLGRSAVDAGGQADDELAPLVRAVARRGDGAAVQLGERPDQRQADAQAPLRAGERAVPLGEEVEHPRQQLRRDADPVVPHPEDDLAPLASRR